jgi:CDP-6-deoxy-D-xylo-4-hexulose-3-dehydrase
MSTLQEIRADIMKLVKKYSALDVEQKNAARSRPESKIAYADRNYDEQERLYLIDSALTFWLTAGEYAERFEKGLAAYLDVPYAYAVNSGSAANQLAFSALTSPLLGERALCRGDEVITVAAAFPTTVAPIVRAGCIPVFVDITIPSHNIDVTLLEKALSSKTRAVFLAHALGNPFNVRAVLEFCDTNKLFLIEDNCDALGAEYDRGYGFEKTGTFGHIGTSSFYPAHHITLGEGGAVYTKDTQLAKILLSLRDWGRDCVCPPGQDNSCGHRFDAQYGTLPPGYDHKYVYSQLGYNMKITDMQAAIGCAQLEKLPKFVSQRRENWQTLKNGLSDAGLLDFLVLPDEELHARHSPFGFIVTVKENSPLSRNALGAAIEAHNIQTRSFFSGNIIRHPCFAALVDGVDYRVVGTLPNTDQVLQNSFWVGVHPGLTKEQLVTMIDAFKSALIKIVTT